MQLYHLNNYTIKMRIVAVTSLCMISVVATENVSQTYVKNNNRTIVVINQLPKQHSVRQSAMIHRDFIPARIESVQRGDHTSIRYQSEDYISESHIPRFRGVRNSDEEVFPPRRRAKPSAKLPIKPDVSRTFIGDGPSTLRRKPPEFQGSFADQKLPRIPRGNQAPSFAPPTFVPRQVPQRIVTTSTTRPTVSPRRPSLESRESIVPTVNKSASEVQSRTTPSIESDGSFDIIKSNGRRVTGRIMGHRADGTPIFQVTDFGLPQSHTVRQNFPTAVPTPAMTTPRPPPIVQSVPTFRPFSEGGRLNGRGVTKPAVDLTQRTHAPHQPTNKQIDQRAWGRENRNNQQLAPFKPFQMAPNAGFGHRRSATATGLLLSGSSKNTTKLLPNLQPVNQPAPSNQKTVNGQSVNQRPVNRNPFPQGNINDISTNQRPNNQQLVKQITLNQRNVNQNFVNRTPRPQPVPFRNNFTSNSVRAGNPLGRRRVGSGRGFSNAHCWDDRPSSVVVNLAPMERVFVDRETCRLRCSMDSIFARTPCRSAVFFIHDGSCVLYAQREPYDRPAQIVKAHGFYLMRRRALCIPNERQRVVTDRRELRRPPLSTTRQPFTSRSPSSRRLQVTLNDSTLLRRTTATVKPPRRTPNKIDDLFKSDLRVANELTERVTRFKFHSLRRLDNVKNGRIGKEKRRQIDKKIFTNNSIPLEILKASKVTRDYRMF